MCGRYEFFPNVNDSDIDELIWIRDAIRQKYRSGDSAYPTGEVFPTDTVPVLARRGDQTEAFLMSWGFPRWDGKGVVINARSETAAKKKMFSSALLRRRCAIPAACFFEWQKKDGSKPKEKFRFTVDGRPVLYMAGLYSVFQEPDTKKASFVILTKEANESMSDIHDRMPVILTRSEVDPWLTDDGFISQAFQRDVQLFRKSDQKEADSDPEQLSLFP